MSAVNPNGSPVSGLPSTESSAQLRETVLPKDSKTYEVLKENVQFLFEQGYKIMGADENGRLYQESIFGRIGHLIEDLFYEGAATKRVQKVVSETLSYLQPGKDLGLTKNYGLHSSEPFSIFKFSEYFVSRSPLSYDSKLEIIARHISYDSKLLEGDIWGNETTQIMTKTIIDYVKPILQNTDKYWVDDTLYESDIPFIDTTLKKIEKLKENEVASKISKTSLGFILRHKVIPAEEIPRVFKTLEDFVEQNEEKRKDLGEIVGFVINKLPNSKKYWEALEKYGSFVESMSSDPSLEVKEEDIPLILEVIKHNIIYTNPDKKNLEKLKLNLDVLSRVKNEKYKGQKEELIVQLNQKLDEIRKHSI